MNKSNDEILAMEARGESLEGLVTGKGHMMPAKHSPENAAQRLSKGHTTDAAKHIARVNVDFTPAMLQSLDAVAERIGINRQASIKEAVDAYVAHKIAAFELQEKFVNDAKNRR